MLNKFNSLCCCIISLPVNIFFISPSLSPFVNKESRRRNRPFVRDPSSADLISATKEMITHTAG